MIQRHTSPPRSSLRLSWQALLLNENVYLTISETKSPMREGVTILIVILLIVGVAQSVGLLLDVLTTPRIDLVQEAILQSLTEMGWYQQLAEESPEFSLSFRQQYILLWQALRIIGGAPSWLGTATAFIVNLVLSLLSWLVYGSVVYLTARWLGSQIGGRRFLGILSLAYAPKLLAVASLIPGVTVPGSLIAGWLLMTKYQVVKSICNFSWRRNLVVILTPYVVIGMALFGIVLLGGAYALSQIPGLDALLKFFGGG